jgi:FkbM family methyltransferase
LERIITIEAENFKLENKKNYSLLSMKDFNTFPLLSGIYKFSTGRFNFDLLCVRNDDSSVVDHFWKGKKDDPDLNLWGDITKQTGIFIDVGSHTGLYTIVGLISNPNNFLISIEPSYLNMGRMMSNLRLNNIFKNHVKILAAASDETGTKNFLFHHDQTFMSKGGRISENGESINVLKLDDININDERKVRGIKIDTEGEDYKVLLGAKNLISKNLPDIIIEVREENKILIKDFLFALGYKFFLVLNDLKEVNIVNLKIDISINIFATVIHD